MVALNRDSGLPPTYLSSFGDSVLASNRRSAQHQPPRYSVIYGDPQEIVPSGARPTEHEFSLRSGVLMTGKPWLTLRVHTRPSMHSHKYPRIFGGENVKGEVQIKLDQPMNITAITLYLRGRMRSASTDQVYSFLEVAHTIWTKDAGHPTHSGKRFDGKFCGDFMFPFSFPFPTEVVIKPRADGAKTKQSIGTTKVSSPQTFMESQINANIDYELVLQVTHGILRPDSKLKATVIYIPEVMPPPLPPMRQATYLGGSGFLPSPEKDPEGWLRLPTVATQIMIQQRTVPLEYKLFLAHPLSYTRGTVIPCYLAVFSRDSGALVALKSPKMHQVALQRSITFLEEPIRGVEQVLRQEKGARMVQDIIQMGAAVWWLPQMDEHSKTEMGDHVIWLEGEIHLEADLPPSSDFLPFKIEYCVQILQPDASVFKHSATGEQSEAPDVVNRELLSHPVTIATLNADGPTPVPFTPKPRRLSLPAARRMGEDSRTSAMFGSGFRLGPV